MKKKQKQTNEMVIEKKKIDKKERIEETRDQKSIVQVQPYRGHFGLSKLDLFALIPFSLKFSPRIGEIDFWLARVENIQAPSVFPLKIHPTKHLNTFKNSFISPPPPLFSISLKSI